MAKMGRRDKAIGFALYMDRMERLRQEARAYDVDTVLLYDSDAELTLLQARTAQLGAAGSVLALRQKPENLTYRRLLKLQGSEVAELENNT